MATKLVPLTLEQHQEILYEILYMVDDFCKAHDIPYFLVGGSLLGAVRHQGIIPWDDDVDIAMTRENYNRFIDLFHAEGVEGFELYFHEYTKGYFLPFARMTKTGTWNSNPGTHRIFVDISPYDGCGNTMEEALAYFKTNRRKITEFRDLCSNRFNILYNCWKSKLLFFILKFPKELITLFPQIVFPQKRAKYLSKLNSKFALKSIIDTKYCANFVAGRYGKGEVQPSTSFLKLAKMRFGTRDLPIPSGWHEYLTGIYGDYITPLPENKRVRHTETSYLIVKQ